MPLTMKKVHYFLIVFILALVQNNAAQQLSLQWVQRFGQNGWDYVNTMVTDSSGNYMLGGSLKGTLQNDTTQPDLAYSNNAFLASCDTNGNILWQKTFGGKMFENITSMIRGQHGLLISGIFQDTIRFGSLLATTSAYTGAYLALVDDKGSPVWLKNFGGQAIIKQILLCSSPDSGIYMAAVFTDSLQLAGKEMAKPGEKGFFLSKLLTDSTESDPLVFKGSGTCNLGGICYSDSLICLAGSFSDTLHINDTTLISFGEEDAFIAMFTLTGKLKHLVSAIGMGNEQVCSIVSSPSGEIGIIGSFDYSTLLGNKIIQTNGGKDIFVAVIDTSGKLKWIRSIGGLGNDYGYTITANDSNDYYITGNFIHNIKMLDENGNVVEMDALNAFGNAFIARYDEAGDLKASFNLPATSEDYCKSLLLDDKGMITAAGSFYQNMRLQSPLGDTINLVSEGERDIFLLRFKDMCLNYSIDAGADTAVCPGQSIFLSSPEIYPFFQWLPGGLPNHDLEVTKAGTYKLLITNEYGCIASDSILVKMNQLPLAFAGNDTTIGAGKNLHLEKASVSNAHSVEWKTSGTGYYGDPNLVSTEYLPSFADISVGRVELTITATNQCSTADSSFMLSIHQDEDGITVFPNPTKGLVTLVCTDGISIQSVYITKQSGSVIFPTRKVNNTVFQYDLSAFPPGTFLFHLTTGTKKVTKIINKL
jgi:hypothetical protein